MTQHTSPTVACINGQWYDGRGFRLETVYVVDGRLTRKRPKLVSVMDDLKGGYVIPPLADAHCHHFDNEEMVRRLVPTYLKEGVFYAQSMTNWTSGRKAVASLVNKPQSVDVAYADAGLTPTDGHGMNIYEYLANNIYQDWNKPETREKVRKSRKAENDAYYIVDNEAMLTPVFARITKSPPDLLKIYLLHSEKHAELVRGGGFGDKGLDPTLIPEIVRRAHRLSLRVYAHVETIQDFRTALTAGVDGFAHLPGYSFPLDKYHPELYELTEEDARLARRKNVTVQPTVWLAKGYADKDTAALDKAKALQKRNLLRLKKHGVRIAIGSDSYGTGPWPEVEYLNTLDVFTPAELLKIWTEATPRSIFPKRRIGRLADGYEASFLVLEKNPLEEWQNLRTIRRRTKQGVVLPDILSP